MNEPHTAMRCVAKTVSPEKYCHTVPIFILGQGDVFYSFFQQVGSGIGYDLEGSGLPFQYILEAIHTHEAAAQPEGRSDAPGI